MAKPKSKPKLPPAYRSISTVLFRPGVNGPTWDAIDANRAFVMSLTTDGLVALINHPDRSQIITILNVPGRTAPIRCLPGWNINERFDLEATRDTAIEKAWANIKAAQEASWARR